jgi:PPOX class probable FMN-dependent enzyme
MSQHDVEPDRDPHRIETVEELREIVGSPNAVVPQKVFGSIAEPMLEFIGKSPFLVLSTSDENGRQDASPKGDAAGFVVVDDARTLLIPDRVGNKLAMGHENVLSNPNVGVLFLVPGTRETLRVNGRAELTRDPAVLARLAARGRPAQLAIRVRVDEVFFHCAKAFVRAQLWKPETWPERVRISFGAQLASKLGAGDDVVRAIDEAVDQDIQDLEARL